jgi:hypothetical protein
MIEEGKEKWDGEKEYPDTANATTMLHSIIPDPLRHIPSWYNKEALAAVPTLRVKYPMHNPFGPRWYKNYHLIPPSQTRPSPSVFSPFVPPTTHERSVDQSRMAGPSRTPSGSPWPTPTSSQTSIAVNVGMPRSRKTSQTAHDPVDVFDPWGTNEDHYSPYDIELTFNATVESNEVCFFAQDRLLEFNYRHEGHSPQRPRLANPSANQDRHKTASPSPLSQSPSAVHLQAPDTDGTHISYKLSKRHKPVLGGLFGGHARNADNTAPRALSLSTSLLDLSLSSQSADDLLRSKKTSRPYSALPPPTTSMGGPPVSSSNKSGKQTIGGRLAKTFSLMRRPTLDLEDGGRRGGSFHNNDSPEGANPGERIRSSLSIPNPNQPPPTLEQRNSAEPLKRVPPSPVESSSAPTGYAGIADAENDDNRSSTSLSLEPAFSAGKLTIVNPDSPTPDEGKTPAQRGFSEVAPEPTPVDPPPRDQPNHAVLMNDQGNILFSTRTEDVDSPPMAEHLTTALNTKESKINSKPPDLTGLVTRSKTFASAFGGFADVWEAKWCNINVAVKVLRPPLEDEVAKSKLKKVIIISASDLTYS